MIRLLCLTNDVEINRPKRSGTNYFMTQINKLFYNTISVRVKYSMKVCGYEKTLIKSELK